MPELSVVIPSVNGWGDLSGCLEALDRQRSEVDLEVVVVDRMGETVRSAVRRDFPWVTLLEVPQGATIPEMRAEGFRTATAPAVGVLEDHVLVREGWGRQMLAGLETGAAAVGGAIENAATDTVCDWATFLCEYSHCLPPLPEGESDWLTGNNVVYSRDALDRHAEVIDQHKWENNLHDAIRDGGGTLLCRPGIVADHKKHFTMGEYVVLRYHFSRSFAGARVSDKPLPVRFVYAGASLLLPPLLYFRTVQRILQKGRHKDHLVRSLPYIAVFVLAWAWGETVGYLAGMGDSMSRVT